MPSVATVPWNPNHHQHHHRFGIDPISTIFNIRVVDHVRYLIHKSLQIEQQTETCSLRAVIKPVGVLAVCALFQCDVISWRGQLSRRSSAAVCRWRAQMNGLRYQHLRSGRTSYLRQGVVQLSARQSGDERQLNTASTAVCRARELRSCGQLGAGGSLEQFNEAPKTANTD